MLMSISVLRQRLRAVITRSSKEQFLGIVMHCRIKFARKRIFITTPYSLRLSLNLTVTLCISRSHIPIHLHRLLRMS